MTLYLSLIPPHWVSRWQFLIDLTTELAPEKIEWTYTSEEELTQWMTLNHCMDEQRHRLLPLSSVWSTIQFMNPVDACYLQYVDIDVPDRLTLYQQLGQYARRRGRPDYLVDMTNGLYWNFGLHWDPAYHASDEATREVALTMPLDVVTAILQQAYHKYRSGSSSKLEGEVPWSFVNWPDVATLCPTDCLHGRGLAEMAQEGRPDDLQRALTRYTSKTWSPDALCYMLGGVREPDDTSIIRTLIVAERSGLKYEAKVPDFPLLWECLIRHALAYDSRMRRMLGSAVLDALCSCNTLGIRSGHKSFWMFIHEYVTMEMRAYPLVRTGEMGEVCKFILDTKGRVTLQAYALSVAATKCNQDEQLVADAFCAEVEKILSA